jgi:sugar/nucleoside kinase (ribokinase family)
VVRVGTAPRRGDTTSGLCGGARDALDVQLAGTIFLDLVFSGLTGRPRLGTEIRTAALGSSPGGVANLAVALARLDLRVGLAAAFSTDLYGSYLWRTLGEQEGVDLSASRQVVGWATPVTVSLAYERERSMITYEEPPPLPTGQLLASARHARSFFTHVDERPMPWLRRVREAGATVFADVGWDASERWSAGVLDNLAAVQVFMPNAIEAMAYTRTADPEAALEALAPLVPVAVVKCGRDGALACSPATGEWVREPAIQVEALDPTGAGDVFGAGIVLGTLEGWPLAERVRFANLCAGLSCRYSGGSLAAPCWNEVASWCRELEADPQVPAGTKRGYRFLRPYYDRHVRSVKCRRPSPTIIAG